MGTREWGLTRSCKVVDAPCMELPPATLIFVLGVGEEVREDVLERTLGRSEMRWPDADGGGLAATHNSQSAFLL